MKLSALLEALDRPGAHLEAICDLRTSEQWPTRVALCGLVSRHETTLRAALGASVHFSVPRYGWAEHTAFVVLLQHDLRPGVRLEGLKDRRGGRLARREHDSEDLVRFGDERDRTRYLPKFKRFASNLPPKLRAYPELLVGWGRQLVDVDGDDVRLALEPCLAISDRAWFERVAGRSLPISRIADLQELCQRSISAVRGGGGLTSSEWDRRERYLQSIDPVDVPRLFVPRTTRGSIDSQPFGTPVAFHATKASASCIFVAGVSCAGQPPIFELAGRFDQGYGAIVRPRFGFSRGL